MSIVGPRPHAIAHDGYYSRLIEEHAFRHHAKPAITGWGQVKGLRGETPLVRNMKARVEKDIWYIDNWSIWPDIMIIIRTASVVFGHKMVYRRPAAALIDRVAVGHFASLRRAPLAGQDQIMILQQQGPALPSRPGAGPIQPRGATAAGEMRGSTCAFCPAIQPAGRNSLADVQSGSEAARHVACCHCREMNGDGSDDAL